MKKREFRGAQSFKELLVWRKAHELVLGCYWLSRAFPADERFGLVSQLRRAAVSVPANIAEGFVKRGSSDKMRFYNIAQGSLEEVRYYLILTQDLSFAETSQLQEKLEEVSRMLESYVSAISRNRAN